MISEQRIIELLKSSYAKEFNVPTDEVPDVEEQDVRFGAAFANALQAEWIKSLGEPKAIVRKDPVRRGKNCTVSDVLDTLNDGTKLYALPHEEVK